MNNYMFTVFAFVFTFACGQAIDKSGCGESKGCWSASRGNCNNNQEDDSSQTDCQRHFFVSWSKMTKNGQIDDRRGYFCDGYLINLVADVSDVQGPPDSGRYVALAFSHDEFMGEDSVIECVHDTSRNRIQAFMSFNDGSGNYRLDKASKSMIAISNATVSSYRDGIISCNVIRCTKPNDNLSGEDKSEVFNLDANPWQLQIAVGRSKSGTNVIAMHSLSDGDLYPWVATDKVSLADHSNVGGSKHYVNGIPRSVQYKMVEAHAMMFLIAWWILASIAMIISRYFKDVWAEKKLFGTAVWYQLHRDLLVLSVVLQVIAFVLIFVQAGDFKTCTRKCDDKDYALFIHAILGTVCTIIAVIQPFLAWIRPGPDTKFRAIFNWGHWFLGVTSWILATITIFQSPPIGKSGLQRTFKRKPLALMGGYVAGFVLVNLAFELLRACSKRGDENRYVVNPDVPLGVINGPSSRKDQTHGQNSRKISMLKFSLLVIFGLFAIAVVGGLCAYIYLVHANH